MTSMLSNGEEKCETGHNWNAYGGNTSVYIDECIDCGERQHRKVLYSGPVAIGAEPVQNCRHARTCVTVAGSRAGDTFCKGCGEYIDPTFNRERKSAMATFRSYATNAIRELDATVNGVGVECFMRLKYGTLDHLSREEFAAEIELAKQIEAVNPGELRLCADSYNRASEFDAFAAEYLRPEE